MKAIEALRAGLPTQFDPARSKLKNTKLDAIIDFARKIQDWPLLEQAIDEKIVEQEQFVQWWRESVRGPGKINSRRTGGIECSAAEKQTGITTQQVSRWNAKLKNPSRYRAMLITAAYKKAQIVVADNHRAQGTGDNEWYTPAEYVEKARAVLGEIDVDPASSEFAQNVIQAGRYFTRKDDGLLKEWPGRVWLNPPYAQPDISNFVYKLISEIESGRTTSAILLTHNYTDTDWFHRAESRAALICFTKGRIAFVNDIGEKAAPTQGQAFFYYGNDGETFYRTFGEVGFIR